MCVHLLVRAVSNNKLNTDTLSLGKLPEISPLNQLRYTLAYNITIYYNIYIHLYPKKKVHNTGNYIFK